MRKNPSPKIVVGPNDSMPDVLTRLRTATGTPATLAIPAASSLFLTASEFRALKAAAETARITLTVETDDRLRRQLATMFEIPVIDLLPGAVSNLEDVPGPEPATADAPEVPAPEAERRRLNLPPAIEVAPKWERPDPDDEDEDDERPVRMRRPRSQRQVPVKWIGIGAVALIGLLMVAAIIAYVSQKAIIAVTVARQPVTAEVTYAVVGPDAQAPEGALFTIPAAPVTYEVRFTETIEATGVLREPDQVASGSVALRNPSNQDVQIAEGFVFAAKDGVQYTVTAAVTVPKADANGAGRATAQIRAVTGGEDANRDAGMLSGQMDNGVFFSNRDGAVAGGTDKKTQVVDQKDIDTLVANATQQLPNLASNQPLPDGRRVLPGSIDAGELQYTTDQQAGATVGTVSIEAKMIVTALAYLPADAANQANQQLLANLTASTPAGYELEPDTIQPAEPSLINDAGDAGLYRLTATANARYILTESDQRSIADQVKGKPVDEVVAMLEALPQVEEAKIGSSPSFLPVRVPGDATKIEINPE